MEEHLPQGVGKSGVRFSSLCHFFSYRYTHPWAPRTTYLPAVSNDKKPLLSTERCQALPWLAPVIRRFHIWKFAYLLKCICNPKTNICSASASMHRVARNLSHPTWFPTDMNKMTFCLLVSALFVNTYPFRSMFTAMFLHFVPFAGDFPVSNGPQG